MTIETYAQHGIYRPSIRKDPDAVLDYSWDWSDWLDALGDVIDTYSVNVDGVTAATPTLGNGTTDDGEVFANGLVSVFLSGGTASAVASATCRIVTVAGRTEDRTIYLRVMER